MTVFKQCNSKALDVLLRFFLFKAVLVLYKRVSFVEWCESYSNSNCFFYVVTAKNPPPICAHVPFLKKELSLCVDLYDLDVTKQYIHGCMKLEVKIAFVKVKSLDLGCFKIPLYNLRSQHTAALIVESIQAARLKNDLYWK